MRRVLHCLSLGLIVAAACATPPWLSNAEIPPIEMPSLPEKNVRVFTSAMLFRPFEPGEETSPALVSTLSIGARAGEESGEVIVLTERKPGRIVGSGPWYLDVEFEPGGVLRFHHCPRLFRFDTFSLRCERARPEGLPPTEAERSAEATEDARQEVWVVYRAKRFRVDYDWGLRIDPAELAKVGSP
jgi:hypothetical protein